MRRPNFSLVHVVSVRAVALLGAWTLPLHAAAACVIDADCGDGLWCNGEEVCMPGDPRADAQGCIHAAPGTDICPGFIRCDEASDRCYCSEAADCTNGLFCDGVERCMPGAAGADGYGCLPGTRACPVGQACSESTDMCYPTCPDLDGDGHRESSCEGSGSDDCDDADPNRFPGNPEVCDGSDEHDEDCNPCTIDSNTYPADADLDMYPAMGCSNTFGVITPVCDPYRTFVDTTAMRVRGLDCDDSVASVHPTQIEACNGRDDDCSGAADDVAWCEGTDGGVSMTDGGSTTDSGVSMTDGGPTTDSGVSLPDVGVTAFDAGPEPTRGGGGICSATHGRSSHAAASLGALALALFLVARRAR